MKNRAVPFSSPEILRQELKGYDGAHLAEIHFDRWGKTVVVAAVVRSPGAFTAGQVAQLEHKLPHPPDKAELQLRLRHVPTLVMTREGSLHQQKE